MATTHYSIATKNQPTIHPLSPPKALHLLGHEPHNTTNLLPTWTPLPNLGITSKRGLESDTEDNGDTSEIDELSPDDTVIVVRPPIKKQKIATKKYTPLRGQNTKPPSTRRIKGSSKIPGPPTAGSVSGAPLTDEDLFAPHPPNRRVASSSLDVQSSLSSINQATTSNFVLFDAVAKAELDSTRKISSLSNQARATTSEVIVPDALSPIKRRFRSSRAIALSASTSASESVSSSSKTPTEQAPTEYRARPRRRTAQPQWEPPKESRRRVVVLPTRELDANELEVLTNAKVSPIVFQEPRYAPEPRSEEREAALRWNLRWVTKMVERVSIGEEGEGRNGRGVSEMRKGFAPAALPELTRGQRSALRLDEIFREASEEEVGSAASEQ